MRSASAAGAGAQLMRLKMNKEPAGRPAGSFCVKR